MEMEFVLILLTPVIAAYVIGQTRTFLRLVGLVRRPGEIIESALADKCVINLCIMPPLMMLLGVGCRRLFHLPPYWWTSENPLTLMAFSTWGAAVSTVLWALIGAWFFVVIHTPQRLYGRGSAFVPISLMAQICLIYAAAVFWMKGWEFTRGWRSWPAAGDWSLVEWTTAIFAFYVPIAPLIGFVLLIVHVIRVRAAKTWETTVPAEQEEIP